MDDTSKMNEKNITLELRFRPQRSPNWGRRLRPQSRPKTRTSRETISTQNSHKFNTRDESKENYALYKRTLSPARHAPPIPQLSSRFDSRATHARTNLPAACASVPFGFTLARVRVRFLLEGTSRQTLRKSTRVMPLYPLLMGTIRLICS
jgi:hypothetical protein